MKIMTTYKTKIRDSHSALANTVGIYRQAVDFLHHTKSNPCPKYDFDSRFGKFPSYLRRAAITEAVGKVSSYKSNYANWEEIRKGKNLGFPLQGISTPLCIETTALFVLAHIQPD